MEEIYYISNFYNRNEKVRLTVKIKMRDKAKPYPKVLFVAKCYEFSSHISDF